ncbi:Uncharacterised protein [Mycobacteroides abscessus]|nr:Uncharacterised protein [Mycobacteroides abscessus]
MSPSATPTTSRSPEDVAAAMIATPANAEAMPTSRRRGKPSPSRTPASTATRTGATLTRSAVVPASRCCSAALSARL